MPVRPMLASAPDHGLTISQLLKLSGYLLDCEVEALAHFSAGAYLYEVGTVSLVTAGKHYFPCVTVSCPLRTSRYSVVKDLACCPFAAGGLSVMVFTLLPVLWFVNHFSKEFQRLRIFPGGRMRSLSEYHGIVIRLLDGACPLIQLEFAHVVHRSRLRRVPAAFLRYRQQVLLRSERHRVAARYHLRLLALV